MEHLELPDGKIPIHIAIEAYRNQLIAVHTFATKVMIPVLHSQVLRSDQEEAVIGTYDRMVLLAESLTKLDDPRYVQNAKMVSRSLFEILMDLKLLIIDKNLAGKFWAFSDVQRFHAAEKLKNFLDQNPAIDQSEHQLEIKYVADPKNKQNVLKLLKEHWNIVPDAKGKIKKLTNWMNLDLCAMAQRVDRENHTGKTYELTYKSSNPNQNWMVHGGSTGMKGIDRNGLSIMYGIGMMESADLLSDATKSISVFFRFFEINPNVENVLNEVLKTALKHVEKFFQENDSED